MLKRRAAIPHGRCNGCDVQRQAGPRSIAHRAPTVRRMTRINATLPTLGTVPVDFHRESARVLDFIGERELVRLQNVPHLGLASSVFTGVNHSRLEYVLLQCAMIGLVGKLHRNNEAFAISNIVTLNGMPQDVSSGEELLKCWVLLSNFGHAQYTYGVERALLQAARSDAAIAGWLCSSTRDSALRQWCRDVISGYRDDHVHFLLSLARIKLGPARDRRKTACIHLLRNLILPVTDLFPTDRSKQYKLARLRQLFARIRLLSMTTLDAYYSHHPFRIQLNGAVISLAELTSTSGEETGFEKVVRETAGWLADELYLHATATTVQREYEVRIEEQLARRFAKVKDRPHRLQGFVNNFMWNGFGRPSTDVLVHLVRLSFTRQRPPLLGRQDLYSVLRRLEGDLANPPATYATIDRNRFTRAVHLDLLYRRASAQSSDVASVFARLSQWLVKGLEADALVRFRRVLPVDARIATARKRMAQRFLHMQLEREEPILLSLFQSVFKYLLPNDRRGVLGEMMPDDTMARTVWVRLRTDSGELYDHVLPELARQIDDNPRSYGPDRLAELRALRRVVMRSRAPLMLVCTEKFVVRDDFGKARHEWDGVVVEFSPQGVRVRIIEAKNLASHHQNEEQSMKQLKLSIAVLCKRRGLTFQRDRLKGIGAVLTCSMLVR
jgi:hypothetical protein